MVIGHDSTSSFRAAMGGAIRRRSSSLGKPLAAPLPMALLISLFTALLLQGCVGAYVPDEDPKQRFDEAVLEALLGATSEEVAKELGCPKRTVHDGELTYFVYEGLIKVTVAVVSIGGPMLLSESEPICSLLEFGPDRRLKHYDVEGGAGFFIMAAGGTERNCPLAFWSEHELEELDRAHRQTVEKSVLEGNARAMHACTDGAFDQCLIVSLDTPEWRPCCFAAHAGHQSARFAYATHVRTIKPETPETRIEAFKWFSLADVSGHVRGAAGRNTMAGKMTEDEIAEAERMVSEWQPNPHECEVPLTPSN